MFKKAIFTVILTFSPLFSFAKMPQPLMDTYKKLIQSDNWRMVQLNTDKIYLINKNNHNGCEKLLDSETPSYAWDVDIRKYINPVPGANIDIPDDVVNKLKFIILTKTPENKTLPPENFIKQQVKNNNLYCEALNFSFI